MNQIAIKTRVKLVAIALLMAIAGFTSCEKFTFTPPPVDPDATWKLSADIQPIFNEKCISCHAGTTAPDLREGKSYNALHKGGYVALPAETSKLYLKLNSSGHISRTIESDRLKILYWTEQGALNN